MRLKRLPEISKRNLAANCGSVKIQINVDPYKIGKLRWAFGSFGDIFQVAGVQSENVDYFGRIIFFWKDFSKKRFPCRWRGIYRILLFAKLL